MVRAPCCEKMGLKKGPWTPEEDQILISYIQKYGHANWRALPKQAGLLRCGKSCRLRWINYLRPDIKRGNFTREEEDTIIKLHEMMGNRWSAIAAKLPGRTDNEIKNVWHTHLKKRLKQNQPNSNAKTKTKNIVITQFDPNPNVTVEQPLRSPEYTSSSDFSLATEASSFTTIGETNYNPDVRKQESDHGNGIELDSVDTIIMPEIDDSFWTEDEALLVEESTNNTNSAMPSSSNHSIDVLNPYEIQAHFSYNNSFETMEPSYTYSSQVHDDDMRFWFNIFMRAGDTHELQEF